MLIKIWDNATVREAEMGESKCDFTFESSVYISKEVNW